MTRICALSLLTFILFYFPSCGTDTDGDGQPDITDQCPTDPNKIVPGECGCNMPEGTCSNDADSDGDGTNDTDDKCPIDPNKIEPGQCGCGIADIDNDGDQTPDCIDNCPSDAHKLEPGECGCGIQEGTCSGSNQKPIVSFVQPTGGEVTQDLGVVVEANDPDGQVIKVDLYINNKMVRTENDSPYTWGIANNTHQDDEIIGLPPGNYELKAVATDDKDDAASAVISITVSDQTTIDFEKGWQIVNTGYQTDDMVVVGKVMTSDLLPSNPANTDCSEEFNNAFKELGSQGGGVVYAPEGEYLFTKPLKLPFNVVLRGAWGSVQGSDKSVRGTVLKVKYNGLFTNNAPAFIQLNSRAGLRDLTIWYPNQDLDNVIPYTSTIDGATDKPDELLIENINLVNSYVGLYIKGNAKRPFCRGLYGSPLNIGMYQYRSSSVPTYTQVYFSADYWSDSGLPGAPSQSELKSYLKTNATAIKVGGSDNIFASEWHVDSYRIGLHFIKNDGGNINGNMYGFYITNCKEALRADSIGPSFIINSVFESSNTAVTIKGLDSVIGVLFNNCSFRSSSTNAVECTNTDTARAIKFQNCEFNRPIKAGSSYLTVVNSKFVNSSGKPIQLDSNTKLAILAGNNFTTSGDPVQLNGANSSNVKRYEKNTFSENYTHFDVNGYNKIRKPSAPNIIVMGSNGYSVNVDGSTDDSTKIQKALDDVHAMGGGIVLLPQKSQNGYAIRNTLNVPEGVELRGTAEGLHSFNGPREEVPSALLQIYHGKNGDTPTIILNKGSGFKGLTVHYPNQQMNNITAYAPTIKIIGNNAYVINNQFLNSYIHMTLEGSDNVLVESNLMSHVYRNFQITDCENARLNHNFIRGEWDDSGFNTVGNEDSFEKWSEKNNIAYEITNSRNIEIFASFSRCSKNLGLIRNSTMHTLQFSMEGCSNAIKIEGIPQGKSVELIGSSLRTDHGGSTSDSMFDIKTGSSDGNFRVFSALCTGYPANLIKATDANMVFQNSFVRLDEKDTTIKLSGSGAGVVRMENCTIIRHTTALSIQNSTGKRMEVLGCHFQDGMQNSSSPSQVTNSVNPNDLSGSIRIVDVANKGLQL